MFQEGEPDTYGMYLDDGEGFTYTYDACSRLTGVTGPDGVRQASYAYDPAGNLTEETDAEGRCTYRSYTAFGELKEQLKPALEKDGVMLYETTWRSTTGVGKCAAGTATWRYWDSNAAAGEGGQRRTGAALPTTAKPQDPCGGQAGAVISYRYDVQGKAGL